MNKAGENKMSELYDLDLNPDVIHDNSSTYVSLLDQNKVDLFSDERLQEKEKEELLKKKENITIIQSLFQKESETVPVDLTYKELLFAKPMVIEKKQSYQTEEDKSGYILWGGCAILMVLFVLAMRRYFKKRKIALSTD